MSDDAELLRRYAENGAEEAFAELVQRRLDLVYNIALRKLGGDAHLAQDVTQRVFVDLARKARALCRHPVLTGWLFTSAHYAATQLVRAERRRRAREEKAETMNELHRDDAASMIDWERLRPLLDDLIRDLEERDRAAVLLRFFEARSFAEIGVRLRLTEDGARSRVQRALDKLHAALARRGVTSTTAALAAGLARQVGTAAPTGLAATVTNAAVAISSAQAGWLALLGISKTQLVICAAVVGSAGAVWMRGRQAQTRLVREVATLRQEEQAIAALRVENRQLAQRLGEVEELRRTSAQLASVRAEAAALQRRAAATSPRPAAVAPDRSAANELVTMTLPDADIQTVLSALQIYSGKKIVRDPSLNNVRRVIHLKTDKIPKQQAVELVQAALRNQGIIVEPMADGRLLARALTP